ncbi:MAG: hypothetical protein HFJ41_08920 [Clostridia bacterium]|nr:hypothetical protein [Clostridia bacterium]
MFEKSFTPEDINEAKKFLQILDSVPKDKRFILALVTDAFINGMNTQEQLTVNQSSK